MARYRTYKNGITGHRYKGYYIIKGEKKGNFEIRKEDNSVYKDNLLDYEECEWCIDKETCDTENRSTIMQLYGMEIYQLSVLLLELIQKKEKVGELDEKSENLYKWCEKVRKRKAKGREF